VWAPATWQEATTIVDTVAPSDRVQRIAGKLACAWEPRMFGAEEHRFRLGLPLTELEVADFERHHGIVLPVDYRAFITRIGHGCPGRYGGTGSFYGLLPITAWDEALVEEARPGVLMAAFPSSRDGEYSGDWLADVGLAEDGEEWFPEAIALGHRGCGDMAVLVVTGPARGRVADTCWANSAPVYTPDPGFLAWYERWLDAVLRGELRW
jgi:hypothetical protein